MKNLTLDNITAAAVDSFAGLPDARRRELVQVLVRHLHDYAREVQLSHAEWRAALGFLHRVGDISTPERSEFSLLSDVTGLSSQVDLLWSQAGATPGSNLGPFHAAGSPWRDNPADLIGDNAGPRVLLRSRVLDMQGQPLAGAEVDFWQNAADGLYWQQDPRQPTDNLRCRLRTAANGSFEIATIRPVPYQIPTDGPAYLELVQPAGRGSWRPAHYHLIVSMPGHRTLVTEVFDAEDTYLERDAVFGVREALVGHYVEEQDPAAAQRLGLAGPMVPVMRMDFRLAQG
jgi:protocatechuate 3,4-dioxygenase beta subunit